MSGPSDNRESSGSFNKAAWLEKGARDLMTRAVRIWGDAAQWRMLQEECAELIAAVNRRSRGRGSPEALASEIADVEIMVEQARVMLGDGPVDEAKQLKLSRLAERVILAESEPSRG